MYRVYTIGPDGSYDYTSPRLIECADDSEALAHAAKLKADVEVWEGERLVGVCCVRPLTTEVARRPSAVQIVAGVGAAVVRRTLRYSNAVAKKPKIHLWPSPRSGKGAG